MVKSEVCDVAFGKRLRFLALCSVFILADTLCRFAIYHKTALCRAAPLTSRPSTSIQYCERVRSKGQRTQPQVGVRRLLANACVFPCNALFVIARHCPLWGPQKILCTFVEKAQTRKRVSVIVPDNVISKAQFAPHRPEGTPHYKTHARYFRTCVEKKGAHKQKSEHYCLQ